jgi:polyhydroxyalkanoate synthase
MPDTAAKAWEAAEQAAGALGPEGNALATSDPVEFGRSLLMVLTRAMTRPMEVSAATWSYAMAMAQVWPASVGRLLRWRTQPPLPEDPKDRRFADPAWSSQPGFFALRQAYLAVAKLGQDLLAAGSTDPTTDGKAQLAWDFLVAAMAPTNFLLTNPTALRRAAESRGQSVIAGMSSFATDLLHNGGRPRQVDTSPFELGRNLAATPGKVVFRNHLMELIQYAPQTDQVHEVPLLASPPWINKYYVMDLAPQRSFLEWAVQHERTVFAISYRNPDPSMRDITLDDYLIHGPRTALDVVCDITGASSVDIVGLCLGGAMTAMTAAYLIETGDKRLGALTLLNTLLDYANPGVLGVFTDEKTIARLEQRMARTGVLEGAAMATTFDILRPNDLIFNYVVSNWLLGEHPPAFDILAWNADNTRMPAAMHSFYLRSLYGKNQLAKGELTVAGQRLLLSDIANDTYVVGAINDHIVPWESSYRATQLLGGHVRYVLSSGGHIAGIVNPPSPKSWYEASPEYAATGQEWRATAQRHSGSWWEDWTQWASSRAGNLVAPPSMGSELYPPLGAAPGEYVRG